jgi:hypothetical protein
LVLDPSREPAKSVDAEGIMRSNLIILALLSLTSYLQQQAGTPVGTQEAEKPARPVAQPAAVAPASASAPTPAASGTATLYFYRPRLYRGSAVRIGLFVDGTMAVNLVNGRWASIQIPAGHHVIKPKDDQSGIEVDAEPGQSYYFRSGWGEAGMFHGAHKNIMIVMKEQAAYEIKQLKQLDDKDVSWPGTQTTPTAPAAPVTK